MAFFFLNGTVIYLLAVKSGIYTNVSLFSFVPIYAVAWFLGLITPGAPAGMGVRETVITTMLKGSLSPSDAFAVAILFRIATTVADLFLFGSSFIFSGRNRQ
jgi:hypothetical protein